MKWLKFYPVSVNQSESPGKPSSPSCIDSGEALDLFFTAEQLSDKSLQFSNWHSSIYGATSWAKLGLMSLFHR